MVHHPPMADILGIAREFPALHRDVVASADPGRHPKGLEHLCHRLAEPVQIHLIVLRCIGDKGEVDIAVVVVYCAAAGQPTHHGDPLTADKRPVDLRQGILILADDDRSAVLPQHKKAFPGRDRFKEIFFQRQIPLWVCAVGNIADHRLTSRKQGQRITASAMTR